MLHRRMPAMSHSGMLHVVCDGERLPLIANAQTLCHHICSYIYIYVYIYIHIYITMT